MDNDSIKYRILIVDDDINVLNSLADYFEDDYQVLTASCGWEGIDIASNQHDITCAILDIKMEGMDGIETGRQLNEIIPFTPVIFHTGYPGEYKENQIDQNEKPFDYIVKGLSLPALTRSVRNAVQTYTLKMDNRKLIDLARQDYRMIGRSKVMQNIYHQINSASQSSNNVMITGETGSGKGMVAKAIHFSSDRKNKPFKTFDCNHTPKDLVEAKLFGHVKGAFSGAITDNAGLLQYADGGTVFLDEIGDLSKGSQGKLLEFLDSGKIDTVGYTGPDKTVDVRIISATNKDLNAMIKADLFREDLYFRLVTIEIELPTLNERREDIPILVKERLDYIADKEAVMPKFISDNAMKCLIEFNWKGNVRRLNHIIDSLAATVDHGFIRESEVKARLSLNSSPFHQESTKLADLMAEVEKTHIINALLATNYNINEAASRLDLHHTNLRKKLAKYDINVSELK